MPAAPWLFMGHSHVYTKTRLFYQEKMEFSDLEENPFPAYVYFNLRKEYILPLATGSSDFGGSSYPLCSPQSPWANSWCTWSFLAPPRLRLTSPCTRAGICTKQRKAMQMLPHQTGCRYQLKDRLHFNTQTKSADGEKVFRWKASFIHTQIRTKEEVLPHQDQQCSHHPASIHSRWTVFCTMEMP